MQRPTIPVRPETHKRVKQRAVTEGKPLTDMASELLDFGLLKKKTPNQKSK